MESPPSNEEESSPANKGEIEISQTWSAPLPHPGDLAQYENIVAGAGDRILRMAEEEQNHRHSQENALIKLSAREQRYAFLLRLLGNATWIVFLAVGGILSFQGQEINGLSIIGGTGIMWALVILIRLFRNNANSSNENN